MLHARLRPNRARGCYEKVVRSVNNSSSVEALRPAAPTEMETPSSTTNILVTHNGAAPCALASTAWLEASPRGAYTTARTVGGSSVFELSFHIERLATSSRLMLESDIEEGRPGAREALESNATAVSANALRPRILRCLRDAITAYRQHTKDRTGEVKLTVLVTWEGDDNAAKKPGVQVLAHATSMGAVPSPPIKIQIRGAPRHNATAKDSAWVLQRRVYEDQKPKDVNEIVLVDSASGAVMEGLSSNFFVLKEGQLFTAEEGVLHGSVREALLRVASKEGVPVVLQPPRLEDVSKWEGAFITSTSRLFLPVDELTVPDAEPLICRKFQKSPLVCRLENAVMAELLAHSEPVLD